MKIVLAGAWRWPWYEDACARALRELGNEVRPFAWGSALSRLEERLLLGPGLLKVNRELAALCREFRPDLLFVHRGTHVTREALDEIRRSNPGIALAQYCNDDPFSRQASRLLWRHLRRALPSYDVHFVYRHRNLSDFRSAGARDVRLLRSYFVPWLHYRVDSEEIAQEFRSDVVFVGHYEADGRDRALDVIARDGATVKIFGTGWPGTARAGIRRALGKEYVMALSGARIATCFFSRLNGDTYTRRNFEIPAVGTFMLSEYSEDLASLFEEGREAEFFRSQTEMRDKVRYYLSHDRERREIAAAGQQRLLAGGHGVSNRMREVIRAIGGVHA